MPEYAEGTNVVVIEPDVAKFFPDHDSVNKTLRALVSIVENQNKKLRDQIVPVND